MNNKYSGMTVNERLFVSGLLKEFDEAIEKKAICKVISILRQVNLNDESIFSILKNLGIEIHS